MKTKTCIVVVVLFIATFLFIGAKSKVGGMSAHFGALPRQQTANAEAVSATGKVSRVSVQVNAKVSEK